MVRVKPCDHKFHPRCIVQASVRLRKLECPNCRGTINDVESSYKFTEKESFEHGLLPPSFMAKRAELGKQNFVMVLYIAIPLAILTRIFSQNSNSILESTMRLDPEFSQNAEINFYDLPSNVRFAKETFPLITYAILLVMVANAYRDYVNTHKENEIYQNNHK